MDLKTTDWGQAPLGSVARFIRGITFKPEELINGDSDDAVACMRTKNVQAELDQSDLLFVPSHLVKRDEQYIQPGDMLVSTANSRELVGKTSWVPALPYVATAGGFISILRAETARVLPRYLYHWFTSPRIQETVRNCGRQTTNISNLNYTRCLEVPIPLPYPDDPARSLEEQKRIADILDKSDGICRKQQEVLSLEGSLIISRFLELFGDPLTNPRGWPTGAFGDEIVLLQYGPRFFNEEYSPEGVRIVRITDLDLHGRLHYSAMPKMNVSSEDRRKFLLHPGDVLLARSGATVGKTALFDETAPECIAGAYFIRLRFSNRIRPLYAQHVLRSQSVQTIIMELSRQSAQQNFNGPGIRALPLPVPPLELQDEFVLFHTKLRDASKRFDSAAAQSDQLFESLAQRAFAGEL